MSMFLFYNPSSDPKRYSERARFSAQPTVLSSLGDSLDSRQSHSPKGSALPETVHPSDDNGLQLNIRQAVTGLSTHLEVFPDFKDAFL
jgi:hypothetical protein